MERSGAWSDGYVSDVAYTYGYYEHLNPLASALPMLVAGVSPPGRGTHCELGFGQGVSINMHAAAGGDAWWGTDFNPAQAGFAQMLAGASGAELRLFDQSFEEFCARQDLPQFDSIALHGVWSWISDDNRRCVVDFVRRTLKVGGVLYVSYNALPGWAAFSPLRRLMVEHGQLIGAGGDGIVNRISGALDFVDRLFETQPAYLRANVQVAERIKRLRGQSRHYLAHEFFNRDWAPMHFSELADWLTPAKLSFACSATPSELVDAFVLTSEQLQLLAGIQDRVLRESVRDFCVNQQFRRDYWLRGPRRLSRRECMEAIRGLSYVLVVPRASVPYVLPCAQGEVTLSQSVYAPMLDALADHAPRSLGALENLLAPRGVDLQQIVQGVLLLSGAGYLLRAVDPAQRERQAPCVTRLNRHLLGRAELSADMNFLACPVTGGAVSVPHLHQLFLCARSEGLTSGLAWAEKAWSVLHDLGHRVQGQNGPLETRAEALAALCAEARTFEAERLPILQALGVA